MTTLEEARAALAASEALVLRGEYRAALALLDAAEPILVAALGADDPRVHELRLDRTTLRDMAGMHAFGQALQSELGVASSTDVWDGPSGRRGPPSSA